MTAIAPYLAVVSARFRMMLQYRAAALAGLWTQVFFGFVLIMVYEAFYRSAEELAPASMTLPQVVSYVWLGQALLAMLPWNADGEIRLMIRSGAVAYELCRPMDLYWLWYARALAWRTAPTILRAIPMTIFAVLILPLIGLGEWRLQPPGSAGAAIGFVLAMLCALLLGCAITTVINISLMWTVSGDGVAIVVPAMVSFFSGMIVPLPLFPDWIHAVIRWLPFAGLVDLPYRIYTASIPISDLPWVLLQQMSWTIALVILGRWLLALGMRRVVVQGG
ncbi:MAG TPA: ABC-2 family transporter protein [Tepidisphaeraceae bacterium]|jgi:ABC-2 type transport system permease protein